LDNIVLEWSRQGLPAVNDVLAHYSKLAPKMTTPRKGDYPHYRDSQLGEACCIDPLVGQYKASRAGLGNLLRREHIRTALRAVLRYNFQRTLNQHYNYGRTYATGDEGGVVTGTYPRGGKPSLPFPYQSECWTGLEYGMPSHACCWTTASNARRCRSCKPFVPDTMAQSATCSTNPSAAATTPAVCRLGRWWKIGDGSARLRWRALPSATSQQQRGTINGAPAGVPQMG